VRTSDEHVVEFAIHTGAVPGLTTDSTVAITGSFFSEYTEGRHTGVSGASAAYLLGRCAHHSATLHPSVRTTPLFCRLDAQRPAGSLG